MNVIQRKKKLWRIPLIVAILFTLFWGIWSFFGGQVPATDQLRMINEWIIQFPFPISRWLDVIFAPLLTFILVLIFSSERYRKDKEKFLKRTEEEAKEGGGFGITANVTSVPFYFIFGSGFGLVLGCSTGAAFSLPPSQFIGIGIGILTSLGICLLFSLFVNLICGVYGPILSLIIGLEFILVFSLFAGFGFGLVLSSVVVLQYLFIKRESWVGIGHWLTGK